MSDEAPHTTIEPRVALGEQGHVPVDAPCVQCDYNLRSLAATGNCPECGTPVACSVPVGIDAPWLINVLPDGQGIVADDAPCTRCGRSVRGLKPTDNCPECGAPVAPAIAGRPLRFEPAAWLNKVSRGLALLSFVNGAAFLLFVVTRLSAPFGSGALSLMLGLLILSLPGAAGVFMVTAHSATRLAGRCRGAARAAAVVTGLLALLFVWVFCHWTVAPPPAGERMLRVSLLLAVAFAVLVVCTLLWLADMLVQTRSRRLVLWFRWLASGTGAFYAFWALGPFLRLTNAGLYRTVGSYATWIAGPLVPVWALAMTVFLALAFRRVRKEARIAAAWGLH